MLTECFRAVYDYPYLSSSANHIFDLTVGYSANSVLSATIPGEQQAKKINHVYPNGPSAYGL